MKEGRSERDGVDEAAKHFDKKSRVVEGDEAEAEAGGRGGGRGGAFNKRR